MEGTIMVHDAFQIKSVMITMPEYISGILIGISIDDNLIVYNPKSKENGIYGNKCGGISIIDPEGDFFCLSVNVQFIEDGNLTSLLDKDNNILTSCKNDSLITLAHIQSFFDGNNDSINDIIGIASYDDFIFNYSGPELFVNYMIIPNTPVLYTTIKNTLSLIKISLNKFLRINSEFAVSIFMVKYDAHTGKILYNDIQTPYKLCNLYAPCVTKFCITSQNKLACLKINYPGVNRNILYYDIDRIVQFANEIVFDDNIAAKNVIKIIDTYQHIPKKIEQPITIVHQHIPKKIEKSTTTYPYNLSEILHWIYIKIHKDECKINESYTHDALDEESNPICIYSEYLKWWWDNKTPKGEHDFYSGWKNHKNKFAGK